MDFHELRIKAGLLNADLATLFDVSESTVRRWNRSNSPDYILDRLRLMTGYHPDGKDIQILQGSLVTSTGYHITARDLELIEYRNNLLNHIIGVAEAQNRQLKNLIFHSRSSDDSLISNIYGSAVNNITVLNGGLTPHLS